MSLRSAIARLKLRLSPARRLNRRFDGLEARLVEYLQNQMQLQLALGRIESRQIATGPVSNLRDVEFKAFSQWGEDGIVQHLVRHVPIAKRVFVEFGVESYIEANTRFLLMKDNWTGLVFDGNEQNIECIRRSPIYYQHRLEARCAFITRDNINDLIRAAGIIGDIGLLSIDIDGNDYWIWNAINAVSPRIVIIEYNARFGAARRVTIPYDPNFQRTRAHHSNVYFGASLVALIDLGGRKGYDFVGCNSNGNDAFFVRSDVRPEAIPVRSADEGFAEMKGREARDTEGRLCFLTREQELEILSTLPVVEV